MTRLEEVTIDSIDIDNRVQERVPFDEGDTVTLRVKAAVGASLWQGDDFLTGKLHSNDTTFAFSEGIRDGRIELSRNP
jgi:hypothetical protein